jgi:ribose/xylose/arabinose/galactoside ABC-type transport system permease subunit
MWIISSYVLRELLKVFLITLAGMTVLMLIVGIGHAGNPGIQRGIGSVYVDPRTKKRNAMIVGFINGVVVAKLRVPAFIVTLGMSFVARGVALLISGGNVVGGQPGGMRTFGNESLFYYVAGAEQGGLHFLVKPDVAGAALRGLDRIFSWPVVVTAVVVIIAIFILHRTQPGRHTYAVGGNKEASLRAGVPVDKLTIMIVPGSAMTAGIAGELHTARFSGGSSIGDNLTPHHLLHFARIAYNKDASESFGNFTGLDPLNLPKREARPMTLAVDNSSDSELRKELRRIILEELKAVLAA